jgi:predicted dehydrogenase
VTSQSDLQAALADAAQPPRFSDQARRLGIGIVGVGNIVRHAHLPAYSKHGFRVAGAYDVSAEALADTQASFDLGRVHTSLDQLLDDPAVDVVDVATRAEDRVEVMQAALRAGKHVLGQKPLATSLDAALDTVRLADAQGLKLAVNVNGRWAPPWLTTTRLVERGVIGQPLAVTHLYDASFAWTIGTHFNDMAHFGLYDYSVHWMDIGLRWLRPARPEKIWAQESRLPIQPDDSHTPWEFDVRVQVESGLTLGIRAVCGSANAQRSHPFTVHGTAGTIRGSVLEEGPLTLEADGAAAEVVPEGTWFPDGFAGSMGELLTAIVEDREPDNSARDGLITLEAVLGAVTSAESDGRAVPFTLPAAALH